MITLIAAVSQLGVIGVDGRLPWHCPEDLKHFRNETMGGVMIMGRKTFESMGPSAFEGRKTVIVTSRFDKRGYEPYHAKAPTVERAIEIAREYGRRIYVVGGANVFRDSIPHLDRLLITRIEQPFEGDTLLPDLPFSCFRHIGGFHLSTQATVHEFLRA